MKARHLYVANYLDNSISMYSLENLHEIERFKLKGVEGPYRLLASEGVLYHVDSYSNTVGSIDLASGKQKLATTGAYPTGLCLHTGKLCVSCGEANSIWEYEPSTLMAQNCASVASFPIGITLLNNAPVVSCLFSAQICKLDGGLNVKTKIDLQVMPLCIETINNSIYAGCVLDDVSKLACIKGKEVAFFDCLPCTKIKAIPNTDNIILLHVWDNKACIFNCAKNVASISAKTLKMPDDVEVDEENIYISCMQSDTVQIFDYNLNKVSCIKTQKEPRGIAII